MTVSLTWPPPQVLPQLASLDEVTYAACNTIKHPKKAALAVQQALAKIAGEELAGIIFSESTPGDGKETVDNKDKKSVENAEEVEKNDLNTEKNEVKVEKEEKENDKLIAEDKTRDPVDESNIQPDNKNDKVSQSSDENKTKKNEDNVSEKQNLLKDDSETKEGGEVSKETKQ